MDGYVDVVLVDTDLRHLDQRFTYGTGDVEAGVGALIRVPFHGRLRNAVVVATPTETDVKTRPIKGLLGPGLPPSLLSVAERLAASHLSSLGQALAAILPERVTSEEARALEPGVIPTRVPTPIPEELARTEPRARLLWRPAYGTDRAEVIAELAARRAAAGGAVIVVVSDVDRTSRTASAVLDRCGTAAAWLGADVSARMRYRAWLRLRHGSASIAVGGRGALFAPLEPALIIVDDEGNSVHKEGRAPRYVASREALDRSDAIVILVGVPPSTGSRVASHPKVGALVAISTSSDIRAPAVVAVERQGLQPSAATIAHLKGAAGRILLLVHRRDALAGIAERTGRLLETDTVAVDADTADLAAVRAASGPRVIVSTPVLAADHRIEDVACVAICDADAALSVPGFRTAEGVFATWWRLLDAARPRQVIIETRDREQAATAALLRMDPDAIVTADAEQRHALGYPPYATLVRFETSVDHLARLEQDLATVPDVTILGPVVDEPHGHVFLAKGTNSMLGNLRPLVAAWRADGVRVRIDVDPWDALEVRWR